MTQIVLDVIEPSTGVWRREHGKKVRERLESTSAAMCSFAVGGICGAMAYVSFSFAAIALPVAVLLFLAWKIGRPKRAGRQRGRHRFINVSQTYTASIKG
ncbi:hypothetical protein PQR02_02715 [Paraburkholderia sediminicola]|uniref:hypothetical protein n=1 Tax=Paraburkholderia sediminicola TaxID=458836 RepID=UPI0038B6FF46